ncbi:hypothetical protein [Aquibacillus albus]|uniref:Uncharacterized protein n=1 Tax=Aquibacillus albus TaxID=1168171 RepID=A0ABS2N0I7_9BACI|nr:hypothetical protein [Aquibacillus albus]MBM7571654.1 hypothetical protein [Aquibacillus albus]
MNFYEKLPNDMLMEFYKEVNKKIKKGENTKTMYYELGLIISVINRRGILIEKPSVCQQVASKQSTISA